MHVTIIMLEQQEAKNDDHKFNKILLFSVYQAFLKDTYLNNSTYENVITLMVDPVLQHNFVYHGDKDLVLKIRGKRRRVNNRVEVFFM